MDLMVYALLKKMINGVATGLSKVDYDAENKQLVFTCVDSTILRIGVPDGISKKQQEMLSHMTLETEEDGSYYIAVDGERIGSKLCYFTTSISVGALPANTKFDGVEAADVLEQILVQKNPPEITFTSSLPTTSYYEIGEEQDVTLDIAVNKKSYDIQKVEITSTPSLAEFTNTITTAPWTHSGNMSISDDQTVTVKATDIEGLSATKSITYNFVYPMYASYVDTSVVDITEADVISGQKLVRAKGTTTLAYSSGDVLLRPVFAYPKEYGQLKSVQDVLNQIELITDYTVQEVQIECLDGNMVDYYAYVANTEAILDNFDIKFSW